MKMTRPNLKPPEWKMPPFLGDLYYDLRERRLLPLVALVVVAIFAVPFLLGGGSDESPPPVAGGTEDTMPAQAESASLTVVESKPGLRDYRKRLRSRTPTDPFKQRYTSIPQNAELSVETSSTEAGTGGGGEASVVTPLPTSSEPPESGTPESTPPSNGGGSGSGGNGGGSLDGKQLFGFRPDVRFGVAGSQQLSLHEELPLGSFLPKGDPVVVFIGVTQNGKRALFDVSRELSSVEGEGDCVGGEQSCRILSLQEGQAANLLTEPGARPFRLSVVKIDFVELDIPSKARSSNEIEPRDAGLAQNFTK
jgi:hypothetical protein